MLELKTALRHRHLVSEKRLAICKDCDQFVERTSRCNKCGCAMKYKSLILSSKCPLNKWGKEEEYKENGQS